MKSEHTGFSELLKNTGFQAFLWTQLLGAFNDNVYKFIVSLRAVQVAAQTGAGGEYLSLAGAVFVIPFLLFSGYSGHVADVLSKRSVLIAVKIFEVFVMLLGLAAFFTTRIELMLVVLFLMALHSTIFSPAKYGIVPEMLPVKDLSRANALLEMTTFVAIVLGTVVGTFLFATWKGEPWKMGIFMTGIAVVGFLTSLRITRVPPSGAKQPFRWNPFAEVIVGTRHMLRDRPLWLAVLGISYFWFLGALFQLDLILFGSEVLKADDLHVGLMIACLAVGIGVGSMLAGRLSGNKVELGLVPIGSLFMSLFCVLLWAVKSSYALSVISLALLGLASGIFIVPLNAYLQQRAESKEKGRIIATNNIWNTFGLLLASAALYGMHDLLHISPDKLILIFGLVTLATTAYIVRVIPEFLVRFFFWMLTRMLFRIRTVGAGNIPLRGPALLVSNHVTHIDGFIIQACMQRFIRFMVWRPFVEQKGAAWFWRLGHAIPVTTSRRDIVEAFRRARTEIESGHVVCIFAEGSITRTGNLLPFRRGLEKVAGDLDIPVIPIHLDRLWQSPLSFAGGRFFAKWPRSWRQPVTITFGSPMPAAEATAPVLRQRILEMSSEAVETRKQATDTLPRRFVRNARRNWTRFAMADSTGRELTYGQALTEAILLARWLKRNRPREQKIGILLPPSADCALAHIGIALAGRVSVDASAGTAMVITAKGPATETPAAVYLDDVRSSYSAAQRFGAWLTARLAPSRIICGPADADSLAVVNFSSDSRGVMLSHYNVIAGIEALCQIFWTTPKDRIASEFPFWPSFNVWFPLIAGCGAVYDSESGDAAAARYLIDKHKVTLLFSTQARCSSYLHERARLQATSLRHVVTIGESLPRALSNSFRENLGIELLEGFSCTGMPAMIAVNTPGYEAGRDSQTGNKPGSVGHPLPGVAVRTVDPATLQPPLDGEQGLLLVKSASRMIGYLHQPEAFTEVVRDGWYITGELAAIDEDGFIHLAGRFADAGEQAGEVSAPQQTL